MFADLGFEIPYEVHCTFVGTTTRNLCIKLKEKYGLRQTVDELVKMKDERYIDYLKKNENKDVLPVPGVLELIEKSYSNGLKLAIGSSAPVSEIELVLEAFDIGRFFTAVASGEEVPNSKPSPDTFLLAAQKLGISPEDCLVIEDSDNGVKAAKTAGMKCIAFRNPNTKPQNLSGADLLVNHISEITYDIIIGL
jgi:HAD superfamily hydrolase (TIGR01509 family)